MHKLVVVLALAAAFTAFAAPKRAAAPKAPPPPPVDEGPMVTIGGEGVFAIVNAAGAPEEPLATAAKKIGNIMMINAELRQGEFALAGTKDKMGGANAAKTYKISFDNTAPTLAKVVDQKYTFDKDNKEMKSTYRSPYNGYTPEIVRFFNNDSPLFDVSSDVDSLVKTSKARKRKADTEPTKTEQGEE